MVRSNNNGCVADLLFVIKIKMVVLRHGVLLWRKLFLNIIMVTSQKGLDLIKKYEGLRLKAYKCPAGVWTIGYGHTRGVKEGMTITNEIAEKLLKEDVAPVERDLNAMGLRLRQGQFDALVGFVFNLGIGNFNSSTLKKKILAIMELEKEAAAEFKKWNKAGGKELDGLTKRRAEEAALWLS